MVTKDNSFNPTTTSNSDPTQGSAMDQSSPPTASFPPSAKIFGMAPGNQQHVSPYGPPPPTSEQPPSAPQPSRSEEHQGQSYPQYSYDIQLRYPQVQQPQQPQLQPPRAYPNAPQYTGDPLPPMNFSAVSEQGGQNNYHFEAPHSMDTTGQVAPVGMKPRVTATLWEDESTLCFQVDVKGTCVARREDNHMINGTKLLNVAGMTRGRRDGILKSEKLKHVVKIGPMHLKGVWIPYDRALDFANKEKITELLYPLFVHNIGALLHHPINRGYGTASYNDASQLAQLAQIPRSHEQLRSPPQTHIQPLSPPQSQVQSPVQTHPGYMYSAPPPNAAQVEGAEQRG
ncbi:hypothetical protein EG329_003836 [Mollisiaceae sp. DMI_Dod_QoI]|nr:hypothetical protein EG329_003836 [Helotiales sp. DMI_Dod_QoI]